jgi:hypothetical protein
MGTDEDLKEFFKTGYIVSNYIYDYEAYPKPKRGTNLKPKKKKRKK